MILIHPSIDPVIFSFSGIEIRWYGLSYVLGFIIGIYYIKYLNKFSHKTLKNKIIDNLFIWSVIGVILGGRIGYILFYQTNMLFINPLQILYIWKGGMSFHGGLIGLIISIYFFCKKNSVDFYQISDFVSCAAPIGLFFGRIANFINVELYGRVTEFHFAMIYPTIDNQHRHPSQIYEALLEGLFLFLILNYLFFKKQLGYTTSLFLILYGIFRILIEFIREPDAHIGYFLNFFTLGQLLCIPMIIFGTLIYLKINKK